MLPIGIATSLAMGEFNVTHELRDQSFARAFLAIPFNDMIFFTGTLAAAAWWRKRPDAHRRLMFIATCLLTAAAFARLPFTILALRWYAGVDLLLLLGLVYDLVRHGPRFLVGKSWPCGCFWHVRIGGSHSGDTSSADQLPLLTARRNATALAPGLAVASPPDCRQLPGIADPGLGTEVEPSA